MPAPSSQEMGPLRSTAALAALLLAVVAAGCGASRSGSAGRPGTHPAAFAWLHPAPAPRGWSLARLPDTATLAYPRPWKRIHSDPGTVSAARIDGRSNLIADYLNVTPRQGEETLQNWTAFRPAHNAEDGDRDVRVLASAQGLRFRDGTGSCVIDRYRTPATTYQEIACLVRGPRSTNVVIAAALAARWTQDAPLLERAVSAFLA